MISENSKKLIEEQLKNVEVIQSKRNQGQSESKADQLDTSVDELKEKYLSKTGNDAVSKLRKKFLDTSAPEGDENTKDNEDLSAPAEFNDSEDDVEVGLIKNKNEDGSVDADSEERTIIVSKNNGMLGAQG